AEEREKGRRGEREKGRRGIAKNTKYEERSTKCENISALVFRTSYFALRTLSPPLLPFSPSPLPLPSRLPQSARPFSENRFSRHFRSTFCRRTFDDIYIRPSVGRCALEYQEPRMQHKDPRRRRAVPIWCVGWVLLAA